MSLKNLITTGYGTSIYKKTRLLKDQLTKAATLKNQQIFLQRCITHRILPKSFHMQNPLQNQRSKELQRKYSYDLLVCAKNEVKKKFFKTINCITETRRELEFVLNSNDMTTVSRCTNLARENRFLSTRQKLKKKFESLAARQGVHVANKVPTKQADAAAEQSSTTSGDLPQQIVKPVTLNLSGENVSDDIISILNLGPKFVPTSRKIPYMDIITATESKALTLSRANENTKAQTLRQEVMKILKTARTPTSNLTKKQGLALKELKSNSDVLVYPFDKGSGLVLIKKEEVLQKLKEQVGETKVVKKDPTSAFATNIQNMVRKIKDKITKQEYRDIYPSDPIAPRMYGAIKAHKPEKNFPMRMIVSTIGTANYGLSRFLVKLIQPTLNENDSRLLNSKTFVEKARTWEIDPGETQVSYDVVNLYPSIPIQASISVITTLLQQDESFSSRTKLTIEEVCMLIKITLSRCYFLWEDEIHVLQDSGPIGLSLMVVMAEGFLQFHEKNAISQALSHIPPINLKTFVRYVDDSHARFPSTGEADQFLGYLNAQDENIQYTVEPETEDGLNFLDVNIKNNGLGKYEFAIHRKQAITNVQIKPHSSHDPKVLKGVFKGFVHRAFTLCSDKHIDDELSFLVDSFKENGYSESILTGIIDSYRKNQRINQSTGGVESESIEQANIVKLPWIPGVSVRLKKTFRKAGFKAVFKSGNNLSAILTARNKCKLPKNSSPGIYKVNCSCGKYYIGETKLQVSTRIKQHQKNSFLGNTAHSGLCQHDSVCEGEIQWGEAETIKVEERYYERKIREALEIQRQNAVQAGCNQDAGQYMSNEHWLPIYKQIKRTDVT